MNQYDPIDHGPDPLAYLDSYTDRTGRNVTEWSWSMPAESDEEQSAELADGRTVTTDISDVDTIPSGESDEPEGSESVGGEADESNDGQQSSGIASRLKDSVSGVVSRDGAEETVEDPELTDIHGIVTARIAGGLREAGYESVLEVFEANNNALAEIKGIDVTKAAFIRREAAETLGRSPSVVESPEATHKREENTADTESGRESIESDGHDPMKHNLRIITVPRPERDDDGEKIPLSPADLELYQPNEGNRPLSEVIVALIGGINGEVETGESTSPTGTSAQPTHPQVMMTTVPNPARPTVGLTMVRTWM